MTREEAIDIIRKNIPHLGIGANEMTEALNELIPELRESEDERMMREFNDWLCEEIECRTNDLRDEEDRRTLNMLCYILPKVKDWLESQKEQKPELVQHPPITFAYNSNASRDERLKAALLALLNSDLLKFKEGGYFTKQDLIEWVERTPTDKPIEWSEEDKSILEALIYDIERLPMQGVLTHRPCDSYIKFLKALRPGWKPTDEQRNVLGRFLKFLHESGSPDFGLMDSLLGQLKKL